MFITADCTAEHSQQFDTFSYNYPESCSLDSEFEGVSKEPNTWWDRHSMKVAYCLFAAVYIIPGVYIIYCIYDDFIK